MGLDGVCICKAAAQPLGDLPLKQLPEKQKDVKKQNCEEEGIFKTSGKNFLLDEVSSVRGEVGWQVELPLHGGIRIQIQRKGFYLQDLLNGFLSVFSSEWWSSG